MTAITATEFIKNFGRHNRDAQRSPVAVTNHGKITGYYISAEDYNDLQKAKIESAYRPLLPKIKAKGKEIHSLAKKYGATNIRIFGSVANGEDTPKSDIDFLVSFPKNYDPFKQRIALALKLEELLNRDIDLLVEDELDQHLAPYIMKGVINI